MRAGDDQQHRFSLESGFVVVRRERAEFVPKGSGLGQRGKGWGRGGG